MTSEFEEEFEEEEFESEEFGGEGAEPDPTQGLPDTDDISQELMQEIEATFAAVRKKQLQFLESRGWFVLVFETMKQKMEFIARLDLLADGGDPQDVSGDTLASRLREGTIVKDEMDFGELEGFVRDDINTDGFEEDEVPAEATRYEREGKKWWTGTNYWQNFFDMTFILNVTFESPQGMVEFVNATGTRKLFQSRVSGGFTVRYAMGPEFAATVGVPLGEGEYRVRKPTLSPKLMKLALPLDEK